MSEIKHQCCAKVGDWLRYTCSKAGKFEREGKWYCGTHDPVAVKARDDKRNAKWNAEWNARATAEAQRKETQRRADCFDELVEALQAAIDCGMVPVTSALEGGASKYSRQVQVADMIRAALAKAKGNV